MRITLVQAQAISSCTAILDEKNGESDIQIHDGVGTEFYSRYEGRPGDRVTILQGDRQGLAIAKDKYGKDWVKIELVESRVRGWVQRDYLREWECYTQGRRAEG
ncbi:hypothetical protein PJF56_09490 [Roseofilum sp. BLCC_M91]|uniref:SH3 domain-containing protein n=1 Tax=Roseofilum halophilum BLCC-M91 TaxID=3022259 RepID=A0ABT7BIS8_9CYAN|nr:hypothetical protein [Roseofilum halophilum]MDJ1179098.1 hypothetical protein [Roseofilum halophilum BLCC-M91]